jgi:hypothetical protein
MQLLMLLALAGAISGSLSGAYWGGADGSILGGATGLVFGVTTWLVTGVVLRAVHEHRLNRHFTQDSPDREV